MNGLKRFYNKSVAQTSKQIFSYQIRNITRFTKSHEWITDIDSNGISIVGITDHAQDAVMCLIIYYIDEL